MDVKMSKAALTLWGHSGSSATNRVRIALAVKEISYKFEQIDMWKDEQCSDEWRNQKSPYSQIPILQIDAEDQEEPILLRQSLAIIEYLDEVYPGLHPHMLPDGDPILKARIREMAEIVNSLIQPMQNKLTVEKVAELDKKLAEWLPRAVEAHMIGTTHQGKEELNYWPHWWIRRGFTAIEALLGEEGPFCFGEKVTMADCALVPQVIGAKKYGLDLAPFPKIARVYSSLTSLPKIQEQLHDVLKTFE